MGVDASLFSKNNQSLYYDREYNLKPLDFSEAINLVDTWINISHEGISKQELISYLQELVLESIEPIESMGQHNKQLINSVLDWAKSLDDDSIIISRNDTQDEYYDLREKCCDNG